MLASRSEVFVAHGKHDLSAIAAVGATEDEQGDLSSLTRGNDLLEFYRKSSLEQVLQRYRAYRPDAQVHGSVHTFTLGSLLHCTRSPATLAKLRIKNLVRHPVNFIASHYALVRSAEAHPQLIGHYLDDVYPQVLSEFPELYLLPCGDLRQFMAFAVSCFGVSNLISEVCIPDVETVRMEELTTSLERLQQFCQGLTGLEYGPEQISGFMEAGALNRHRRTGSLSDPFEIFAAWAPWQRNMAQVMMPATVLDWLEGLGYQVSMLRPEACTRESQPDPPWCLGEALRALDPQHPLLASLNGAPRTSIQTIDALLGGYRLQRHQGKFYAVAGTLETGDVTRMSNSEIREHARSGRCLSGQTMEQLWLKIHRVLQQLPKPRNSNWRYYVGRILPLRIRQKLLKHLVRITKG